ncbi:MAG: hypothetical protein DWQ01_19830 [Planctomycetota bacterium]|nr:MAG: hypothetical protein DWQ01_19830 [Planctomycetota bacterium]
MNSKILISSLVAFGMVVTPAVAHGSASDKGDEASKVEVVVAGGTLTGKIVFDGKELPKLGALDMSSKPDHQEHCMKADDKKERVFLIDAKSKGVANVFVEVRNKATRKMKWKPTGPLGPSDQVHCRFEPHIMVVPVGLEVVFKNSDPFMHNVHFYCKKNPAANFGIPENGKKAVTFKSDEKIRVKCDVHTWMDSWVIATSNPYHALTGADGSFKIEGIEPGTYEIRVWHAGFGGYKQKKVEIAEGANNFEVKTSQFKP